MSQTPLARRRRYLGALFVCTLVVLAAVGCSVEFRARALQGPYSGFRDPEATALVSVVKQLEAGIPDETVVAVLRSDGYSEERARALVTKARIALKEAK